MQNPERVGFVGDVPVMVRDNMELVQRPFVYAGNESFPDAGAAARLKRVAIVVPFIKAADDGDFAGVGSPDAEAGAGFSVEDPRMRAQLPVSAVVATLVEKIEIVAGKQTVVVTYGSGNDGVRGFHCVSARATQHSAISIQFPEGRE